MMPRADIRSALVTGAVVACLGTARFATAQFTSFSDRTHAILEGNWQSCRDAAGQYSERVYDNTLPGIGPFELHLGPNREFALFLGIQEEHRPHDSAGNLLRPYTVVIAQNRARQEWEVAGLHLEVALAGGSRTECESWYIMLRRVEQPSSN